MQNEKTVNENEMLVIERSFDYPVEQVYDAFADGEALVSWWPPSDFHSTLHHFDFRTGGMFLFKMESEDAVMWAKLVFGRIVQNSLLEITLSFSDEKGGITRAPFFEHWPLKIFNVVEFKEKAGKTLLTMKSYPVDATGEEIVSFVTNRKSFNGGVEASLDQLANVLSARVV
jgi:uncharacterized protein YndB with AHSA1/START domain